MSTQWPDVTLGPVRRMRALAAAVPGAVIRERVMEAPFDAVWGLTSDLEHGVPRFEPLVASARILRRDGEELVLETRAPLGLRTVFDVVLRDGFCWMQARRRLYVVGMAAESIAGRRTLFAHVEGVPRAGGGLLRPVIARAVRSDLRNIERLARADAGLA